jgi:hypothetical protein
VGALALAARLVLSAAFLLAAAAKVVDRDRVVAQFGELVGPRAGLPVSVALPALEGVLAIALVAAPRSAVPGWCAAAVLFVFTLVLVRAQARHVPCPCFGGGTTARPVGPAAIVRNGVLLAVAVLATGSIDGARAPSVTAWALVLGVVAALVVRAAR